MGEGLFKNAVTISHLVIEKVVEEGDVVVDATCGRGNDTLFLARLVGNKGKVYACDIQGKAISSTLSLLQENNAVGRTVLIKDNHTNLDLYIKQKIKVCMFNLGYLPGGNHTILTDGDNTVITLEKIMKLLDNNGVITVVSYPGHPGGQKELDIITTYLAEIPQQDFEVSQVNFLNQVNHPPQIIIIQKLYGGNR